MKEALTFDDIQIVPKYSEVQVRMDVVTQARVTKNYLLSIPLISSPMDTITEEDMAIAMGMLGGMGIIHRFCTIERQSKMVMKTVNGLALEKPWPPIAAAVGVTGDFLERAQQLELCGANIIVIDVAHGHHSNVKNALMTLKINLRSETDVVAGSVATTVGTRDLIQWGADAIRVGIGNGSVCETRIRTGVGVPQVTALMDCIAVAQEYGIPVMADGGMKTPGCVAKALALGADTCWFGSLFSGTKETPGPFQKIGTWPNEQLFKPYRGSSSLSEKMHLGTAGSGAYPEGKNVEGNSTLVPFKGRVSRITGDILDGLRSAMSYVGARNMDEFSAMSDFVTVTDAGRVEARPHLLMG